MREGKIDLDWLDAEISIYEESIFNFMGETSRKYSAIVSVLKDIRSKCTPIEPPVFLSKTCINSWPNSSYCANEGKCEMCKVNN